MVLVWHYVASQVQAVPGSLPAYGLALLSTTWAGVDVFFVLSGFLIGSTLLHNRTAPNYFGTFYIRRACRIFPLYFLCLLLFETVLRLDGFQRESHASAVWFWLLGEPLPVWSYATFLQNFVMADAGSFGANWMSVTWSLAIEEQFYLVIPLLVRFVPVTVLPGVFCALVVAAAIFRIALQFLHPHPGFASYVLLPARWDALLLGVLGAYALQDRVAIQRLRAGIPVIRWIIAVAALVVVGLTAARQSAGSFGMSAGGYTALAILSLGVIFLALFSAGGRTQRLFRHPLLVWFGGISYGIYLLHQPVSGAIHGVLRDQSPRIAAPSDAVVTAIALLCTLLLATVSARYLERPFILAGQQVRYRT